MIRSRDNNGARSSTSPKPGRDPEKLADRVSDRSKGSPIGDSQELSSSGDADAVKKLNVPTGNRQKLSFADVSGHSCFLLLLLLLSISSGISEAALFDAHDVSVSRVARASQHELSAVFDQLAVSARLLTAISLQNGLVDGTISPDAVTAELLNIGAAELELLKVFDRNKVDGLVEKMKTIGPSLDADPKILPIENVIVLMNEWRLRLEDIGDVKDTSLIDSYLKAVRNTKSFDQTLVDKIERAAIKAETGLNEIPTLDQESDKNIWSTLDTIQETMGILGDASKTLAILTQDLQKMKRVADEKSISTAPQIKFVDFLDEFFLRRGEISKYGQGDYEKLVQLFSSVFSLVSDAKASEGEMRVMGAVSDSRKPLQDRNITSGFLGGFSDIGNLPSDADNKEFKELTGGFDTDVLKMGLTLLESLMMKAADVDKKWSGMSADWIRATKDFRQVSEKLISSGTPPDKATLLMLDKCNDRPNSPTSFYDGIKVFVKNSTMLPNQIDSLTDLSEELSESFHSKGAELLKVKDAIKFSSDDANKKIKEAKTVLAEFKKYSTTEVLAYLGKVKPKLTALRKKMEDVSSLVKDLPDAKNVVAALLADSEMKEFETFFTCMKSLPSQFASASSTVALTRKIRKFANTPTLADNVKKVSSTIEESRSAVGILQKACEGMKGKKTSEIEEIGRLGVSVKDTNNFGVSVMAVGNIRKIGNKKVQIEKFLMDGEKVEAAIQRVQDPKTKSELMVFWGDFPKVKAEISKLMVDLEAKRGTMVIPKAARFADFGTVFGGLGGMLDANMSFDDLRMVLEVLVPTNPELTPMISLFDETDPSDFLFSRFNVPLSEIVAVLPKIDATFVNFMTTTIIAPTKSQTTTPQITTNSPFSIPPALQSDPRLSTTILITTTTSGSILTATNIIYGIAGFFFVALLILGVVFRKNIRRLFKNKKQVPNARSKQPPRLLSTKKSPPRPSLNPVVVNPLDRIPKEPKEKDPIGKETKNKVEVASGGDQLRELEEGKRCETEELLPEDKTQEDDGPADEQPKKCPLPCFAIRRRTKRVDLNKYNKTQDYMKSTDTLEMPDNLVVVDGAQQANVYVENNRIKYDWKTMMKDKLCINQALVHDAWVNDQGKTSQQAETSGLKIWEKMKPDRKKTPVQRVYEERAKQQVEEHPQPFNANMERTRGNRTNFNHYAAPKSNKDLFYHCTRIPYFLYSAAILGQAPMGDDVKDDEKDEREDEDKTDVEENDGKTEDGKTKKEEKGRKEDEVKKKGEEEVQKDAVRTEGQTEVKKEEKGKKEDEVKKKGEEGVQKDAVKAEGQTEVKKEDKGKKEDEVKKKGEEGVQKDAVRAEGQTEVKKEEVKTDQQAGVSPIPVDPINGEPRQSTGADVDGGKTVEQPVERAKTQPPKQEKVFSKKVNTCNSFWSMIFANKCPHIVQACEAKETCLYFPLMPQDPNLLFGKFTISCTQKALRFKDYVEWRKLEMTNTDTGKKHEVIHWSILNWKRKETVLRELWIPIMNVVMATRLTKKPTCFLSKYGTGRAAVMVLVEYYFQMLIDVRQPEPLIATALQILRGFRPGVIESGRQLFFSLLASFDYLILDWHEWAKHKKENLTTPPFNREILKENWNVYYNFLELDWPNNKRDATYPWPENEDVAPESTAKEPEQLDVSIPQGSSVIDIPPHPEGVPEKKP